MPARDQALPHHHLRAEAALLGATVLWGGTFTATSWTLRDVGTWQLLAMRFTLAAALTLLWKHRSLRFHGVMREWLASLWLALTLGAGYVLQTIGLESTTAPRSAFVTSLTVVFVPLLLFALSLRLPRRSTLLGIAVAVVGLWLLCDPRGDTANIGDLWTLACSLVWSLYIIELQRLSPRLDLGRMLIAQFGVIAAVCWLAGGATAANTWDLGPRHWAAILYLGLLGSFVTTAVQCRFQRETTAPRAALIFCAEPVFASLIAWVVLGQTLGVSGGLGAALILAGIVVSEIGRR
jgi:drug/metabolite transporter (DMT)-like permease